MVTKQKQENIRGERNSIANRLSGQEIQEKSSDYYIDDTFSQWQDNTLVDRKITEIKNTDDLSEDGSSLPDLEDHEGRIVSERRPWKRSIEHVN